MICRNFKYCVLRNCLVPGADYFPGESGLRSGKNYLLEPKKKFAELGTRVRILLIPELISNSNFESGISRSSIFVSLLLLLLKITGAATNYLLELGVRKKLYLLELKLLRISENYQANAPHLTERDADRR